MNTCTNLHPLHTVYNLRVEKGILKSNFISQYENWIQFDIEASSSVIFLLTEGTGNVITEAIIKLEINGKKFTLQESPKRFEVRIGF